MVSYCRSDGEDMMKTWAEYFEMVINFGRSTGNEHKCSWRW